MSEQLLLDPCFEIETSQTVSTSSIIRPIHYLGSKLRLSEQINEVINELDPTGGCLCDLFSGSGTVTNVLSQSRAVISVDIQEYSRVICSAILNPSQFTGKDVPSILKKIKSSAHTEKLLWSFEPLIKYEELCIEEAISGKAERLAEILEKGPLISVVLGASKQRSPAYQKASETAQARLEKTNLQNSNKSITSRYFGGIYFSFEQSVWLDAFLYRANSEPQENRDSIKAAVLSTASTLVNTVGNQFAQPIRPKSKDGHIKKGFVSKVERDRKVEALPIFHAYLNDFLSIPESKFKHKAITGDYLDVLKEIGDELSCVYADPPYTRDHYSRYYHVLETMCKRDNPEISIVKRNGEVGLSRGVYRVERHQSPFCIRSQAPDAFFNLFKVVKDFGLPLALSYSPHEQGDGTHPRVVSMEQVQKLAKSVFSSVEVITIDNISHSMLNHSRHKLQTRENAEIILKCR